jgi:hypothetical protein
MSQKEKITVLQNKEVGYPIAMRFGIANTSKLTTQIIFQFLDTILQLETGQLDPPMQGICCVCEQGSLGPDRWTCLVGWGGEGQ